MGQLRAILRCIALDRSGGPTAALDRLDAVNQQSAITAFASVLHAHLARDGPGWSLRWASAGHPPPVLVGPDGPDGAARRGHRNGGDPCGGDAA
jgi:chemotaxis family two-component system sensor kinase Cph1